MKKTNLAKQLTVCPKFVLILNKMRPEEHSTFIHGKIVAICEAMLREEIGIIADSRKLTSLCFELYNKHDDDFLMFVAINSETDHLPVDFERQNWSVEALKMKDVEIANYEAVAKFDALKTCKKLIGRFDMNSNKQ